MQIALAGVDVVRVLCEVGDHAYEDVPERPPVGRHIGKGDLTSGKGGIRF